MTRKCRSCGVENAVDASRCAHCKDPEWNRRDGTKLGGELAALEREDPAVGLAAAKYDRDMAKLLDKMRKGHGGS